MSFPAPRRAGELRFCVVKCLRGEVRGFITFLKINVFILIGG